MQKTRWERLRSIVTLTLDWTVECHEWRCPRREPRDNLTKQVSYDRRLLSASMSAPKPSAMGLTVYTPRGSEAKPR
jgi:hypothetical protein